MSQQTKAAPSSVRDVPVWDLPTRLFHWLLVGSILLILITGWAGWLGIHMQLGRAVLALLLFRFAWGVMGSSTARFSHFVKGPRAALDHLRRERAGGSWDGIGHNPLGAYSVMAMLILALVQAVIGLFSREHTHTLGPLAPLLAAPWSHAASEIHSSLYILLLVVIGLHVAAIVYYKKIKGEDLVRPMITGRKPAPGGAVGDMKTAPLWLAALLAVLSAVVVWGGLALVHG